MTTTTTAPKGMRTFLIIAIGQMISVMGSGLTGYALGFWIYAETGNATPFALVALFSTLPRILLAPLAGVLADRYNRRRIMLAVDSADAFITLGAAALLFSGRLEVWHIYIIAGASSLFGSFQQPAFQASITMLVPKRDLGRASGIQQMGQALEMLLTPVIAGALFGLIGLNGIIAIDLITYGFAVGALLVVRIPQPEYAPHNAHGEKNSLWKDAAFGWSYLRGRPGLFGLLWYFAAINFFLSLSGVLATPLVLGFATPAAAGLVGSVGGAAMLVSSIIMSAWGGPKQRKVPALIFYIGLAAAGFLMTGLLPQVWLSALGRGWLLFFIPWASAMSQAIFQTKVAPEVQGRVFAIRGMIAQSISPIAQGLAGPLADRVFTPLLLPGGNLAATWVGDLMGVGAGRGIGLLFVLSCAAMWGMSLLAYANPRIRDLERELPDALPDEPAADSAEALEAAGAPAG
ncbi:MAG: MFS transporter [Chloroflexi bacterium]|nr:MFS transporter [Chloroflexota bacterium]